LEAIENRIISYNIEFPCGCVTYSQHELVSRRPRSDGIGSVPGAQHDIDYLPEEILTPETTEYFLLPSVCRSLLSEKVMYTIW
jgi:hypothetical protein